MFGLKVNTISMENKFQNNQFSIQLLNLKRNQISNFVFNLFVVRNIKEEEEKGQGQGQGKGGMESWTWRGFSPTKS